MLLCSIFSSFFFPFSLFSFDSMDGWVFMFLVQSIDGRWGCVEWVLEKLVFSPLRSSFSVSMVGLRCVILDFMEFTSLCLLARWWGDRFVQTGLVGYIQ